MATVFGAFAERDALEVALHQLRAEALGPLETYTPQALDEGPSLLPPLVFLAGILGTALGFALQVYANVVAYPLDIGGRPRFSWPSFIPIALEIGILAAVATGFFGYLIVNRLPRLYEPIDESAAIQRASRDLWCVAVHTQDTDAVQRILTDCVADSVEVLTE